LNCTEFRRAVGADPSRLTADAIAHRSTCAACAQYAQETQRLDGLIKRALEIPAPQLQQFAPPAMPRTRWYAMAASVLLTFAIAITLWVGGGSQASLADDIVAHLNFESDAMTVSEARVSNTLLEGALQAKDLRLVQPLNDISYLHSCWIRRAWVPHIVVQTARGPVTVIVLPNEPASSEERFDEEPYHGTIIPMGRGSIVVIANDAALIDDVAAKVRTAIAWN